jgi:outer membrane protein OmpA-like peptidoglycan-associated protein
MFALSIVATLLVGGTALAAEIGLTSVLYPEGKKVDVPIAGTQRAPASELTAKVQHQAGQSSIDIKYKGLQPAVLFGGDFVSYVLWAVAPNGNVENLGGIANDGAPQGSAWYTTATRDFAMMITAEPIVTARTPGDLVVFFSGTPATKGVKPTGFTFGGLSTREGLVTRDKESIAGMSYTADKKNPVILIQAEKAIELLDRFDAKSYDADAYGKATAAIGEARETKGKKQADASKRAIELAGQALSKTGEMMKAEAEAAKEAEAVAERQALAGESAKLIAELESTRGKLTQSEMQLRATRGQLEGTQAKLRSAEAKSAQLSAQSGALEDQLKGALGQMASGMKTDRGYVVSLSGTAFASGKSSLTTDAKYVLAKLSGMLLAHPETKVAAEGHTDSTGGAELNRKLSLARAEAVKTFLHEMGVPEPRMKGAKGFGPDKPVAPNDTAEGRAKNRRVEIVLMGG